MAVRRETRTGTPASLLGPILSVLADRPHASMEEIAIAAGVGRATLYRHYPTRESLLETLAAEALAQVTQRVADASLERTSVVQALERLFRAFFTVGEPYAAIFRQRLVPDAEQAERHVGAPVLAVFRRGIDEGLLRDDLDVDVLVELFFGFGAAAIETDTHRTLGIEEAAAVLTSVFLDGARRR